jgi:hypothetical protein
MMESFKKYQKISLFFFLLLTIFLSLFVFLFSPKGVYAQARVESPNYIIQFPNLNSGAGVPSSETKTIDVTLGGTAAGLFSSTGYRVRSGFQYIHSIIPFSFSISNINIDFGTLTLGVGSTQQTTLTVKAGGAGGYSVKARENHPLQNDATTATIPDTLCDNGNCTQTQAEVWTQSTTEGFGFNMSGDDVPSDFVDSTYFRHFADASVPEDPGTIMNKNEVTWDYPNNLWPWESIANVTFKINITPGQTGGTFRNMIMFTAVPSY